MTRQMFTVGCYKCGEFHAFANHDAADEKLQELRRRPMNNWEHDHDGLSIVVRAKEKVF